MQEDFMQENDFLNDFIAFMANNGYSSTMQRRAIAEAFFNYPGHHTIDEFYHHMSGIDPTIGQTTVYRTLKLLCAAGLASEIQFADSISRYEVANPKSHHDHLLCLRCGKIIEVFDPRIEALQAKIAAAHKFTLQGHSHNLYGECEQCRAAKKASDNISGIQIMRSKESV